jgi:putative ABC transport system substrate-binding protein
MRLGETLLAASRMNLLVRLVEVRSREELDRAFAALRADPPDAVLIASDTFFLANIERVAELALASRLPVLGSTRQLAEAGILASYGADVIAVSRRAATHVNRILKGAKPGDLAIELPTKFELVINLRTANAIGLKIPSAVLARADEVIR